MLTILRWCAVFVSCLICTNGYAQTIYNQAASAPIIIAQSGVAVTNTGIGTAEVNMASIALPPLGPNDAVTVITLWDTTGSTATDTKNIVVRLGSSGCTALSACSSGAAFMNINLNTASLVTSQQYSIISNTNATNAQIGQNAALNPFLSSAQPLTSGTIDTSVGSWINIDSATATSSADTIKLLRYQVLVTRGR